MCQTIKETLPEFTQIALIAQSKAKLVFTMTHVMGFTECMRVAFIQEGNAIIVRYHLTEEGETIVYGFGSVVEAMSFFVEQMGHDMLRDENVGDGRDLVRGLNVEFTQKLAVWAAYEQGLKAGKEIRKGA